MDGNAVWSSYGYKYKQLYTDAVRPAMVQESTAVRLLPFDGEYVSAWRGDRGYDDVDADNYNDVRRNGGEKVKAWVCRDKTECFYSTVVFAETAGKARAIAQNTDCCEDVDWCNISVRRVKELDNQYRGHAEMDWDDREDRRALVGLGWKCWEPSSWECEGCWCRDICDHVDGEEDYL